MAYIGNRVATTGTSIKVDSSAPANSLRVKSNGNIGIGIAEPSSKLHVAGTVTATAFQGDTNTGMWFPAADTIAFSEGGAEVMRITSAGNVGIGTASPATALDVIGTVTATIFEASGGLYLNNDEITANSTIASGKNSMSVGPITLRPDVTVTITSGQRWIIF